MGNLFDGCACRDPEVKKENVINKVNYNTDYYDEEYIIEPVKSKVYIDNNKKIKTYDF